MTEPTSVLDQVDEKPSSSHELITWWEKKRWWYNVLVGITGLVVLGISGLLQQLPFDFWLGIIFYGIAANVGYTLGWASALLLHYYTQSELLFTHRNTLYFIGTVSSILLTYWLARAFVFGWLLGPL